MADFREILANCSHLRLLHGPDAPPEEEQDGEPMHELIAIFQMLDTAYPNVMEMHPRIAGTFIARIAVGRKPTNPALIQIDPALIKELAELELTLLRQQAAKRGMEVADKRHHLHKLDTHSVVASRVSREAYDAHFIDLLEVRNLREEERHEDRAHRRPTTRGLEDMLRRVLPGVLEEVQASLAGHAIRPSDVAEVKAVLEEERKEKVISIWSPSSGPEGDDST